MTKELDSVELARIEFEKNLEDDPNNEWLKRLIKGLNMAEQSLHRLEEIENANSSQALENLKQQAIAFEHSELAIKVANENYTTIKQALLKAQEQEKVLKIIKEKEVDFYTLTDSDALDDYNPKMNWSYRRLTQKEFDLLKRWLEK